MEMKHIVLPVIEIRQQIGKFYIGKITARKIVDLTFSDVRRLTEERDVESYLGIQRLLNKARAKEIQEYVRNIDATFPTGILLSIDSENVIYDEEASVLKISFPEDTSPAKILDGQHRVACFMDIETGKAIEENCLFKQGAETVPFELVVTIFVGLDIAEQANIFATVNIKQTKVSKSLVLKISKHIQRQEARRKRHMKSPLL